LNAENTAAIEMPRYKSHKTVWALKIAQVTIGAFEHDAAITFEDSRYAERIVNILNKPIPQPGWYLVQYEDGYISFSPAEQFEKGNTLDEPFGENVVVADQRSFAQEEINNWFSYRAPTKTQVIQYGEIRTAAKIFAETINKHVPAGADKTAAMRTIRNSVMQANLAIACYVGAPSRPTIAELDKILNSKDDTPVTINRDGSVTVDQV
jgi:hypothetical protein